MTQAKRWHEKRVMFSITPVEARALARFLLDAVGA